MDPVTVLPLTVEKTALLTPNDAKSIVDAINVLTVMVLPSIVENMVLLVLRDETLMVDPVRVLPRIVENTV